MNRAIIALALFSTLNSAVAGSRDGDRGVSLPVEYGFSQGEAAIDDHNRILRQVGEIAARTHLRDQVHAAIGGQYRESSGHRSQIHPLASPAHDRGAIDIVIPNADIRRLHQLAADISRMFESPRTHTTVVEQPVRVPRGAQGPDYDRHSVYINGRHVNETFQAPRASGTHIHVQPNYEVGYRPRPAQQQPSRPSQGGSRPNQRVRSVK